MKAKLCIAAMIALTITLFCQGQKANGQGTQEDFEKLRDKKLQEPWLKKADWTTDYDKARAEAKKSGKMIFAYFMRTYAS